MNSEKKNIDIQKFLESVPDNYSILDQQIDVNIQIEYFELARKLEKKLEIKQISEKAVKLYDEKTSLDDKKSILIKLAALGDVEAFRVIENYMTEVSNNLKDWTALALQESKVLLENSLLDEQKIIISTGLGGRDNKLRYFAVLVHNNEKTFESHQEKILRDEIAFEIEQSSSELETIDFEEHYCKVVLLLPLKFPLKEFFQKIIKECNQYGGFLKSNFLLTNVKILDNQEIKNTIKKMKNKKDT